MLYFSETVCVLTLSSSLPALEGARESSNGLDPYTLLSLLAASELQLDLLEENPGWGDAAPAAVGSSSRNRRGGPPRDGGNKSSADGCGPPAYMCDAGAAFGTTGGSAAVLCVACGIKERPLFTALPSLAVRFELAELSRM